jgi:CheY-like chemotaxis protein
VIGRQVQHLVRLIDDLLDVSRVTLGKVKLETGAVKVAPLIQQALASVQHLVEQRKHTVVLDIADRSLQVNGDPVRIEQILENLLTNAAKYSNDGGQICIAVRTPASEIEIEISDRGLGISEEMLGEIFDLFTQAHSSLDRSQGGLGIGLTLVKSLVQLHDGRISASSKGLGQGSTFTVYLPAWNGAEDDPRVPAATESIAATAGRRVLLVDDNRDIVESLELLLVHSGCTVSTACDGKTAVALFDAVSPDVALLDIGLPDINGFELAKIFRRRKADGILLIAISGYGQYEDRQRALAAGFDVHLTKPIDHSALFELIGNAGGQ